MTATTILQLSTFGMVLWLGLYLIDRDFANPVLRSAGLGAVFYAGVLSASFLAAVPGAPGWLERLSWAILFFPPYFWALALARTFDHRAETNDRPSMALDVGLVLTIGAAAALLTVSQAWDPANQLPALAALGALGIWSALPVIFALRLPAAASANHGALRRPIGMLTAASAFFVLGLGLILFPLSGLPRYWILIGIAVDFEILGWAIVRLDAFDLGEVFLPDMVRSFFPSAIVAAFLAAQVALVIAVSTGPSFAMMALLHVVVASSLAISQFFDALQHFVEQRLIFSRYSRRDRINLRAAARAQTRSAPGGALAAADEETFYRYTRRALSSFSNLPRLTSSPLINLPAIERHIASNGLKDDSLERARVLKSMLTEAILRLKPDSEAGFGETDEWRYFNALYYPYVMGLRPYSRSTTITGLDEEHRRAMEWFRRNVPERTLYNWQNAAARIVARQIRGTDAPEGSQ